MKYLSSKKRGVLLSLVLGFMLYNLMSSSTNESKILTLLLIPMCIMSMVDYLKRIKKP